MEKTEWLDQAVEMKVDQELTWNEITSKLRHYFPEDADEVGVYNTIRGKVRKTERYKQYQSKKQKQDFERGSIEYKADGQIVSEKFITVRDGIDMTPEFILESHGLDVSKWEVVSYKNNFWNSQVKGGAKQISYQSKLTAKPKTNSVTFADFDKYFEKKTFSNDKPLTTAMQYDPSGETLEIDLPDLHAGLLAWRMETGADYDLNITRDRFFACMNDVCARCAGRKF